LPAPATDLTLVRIKRLVIAGRYRFTAKAERERLADGLTRGDVLEAILSADRIRKAIRSTSPWRGARKEKLYVIEGCTYDGVPVYTKGTIRRLAATETFYILVSSKRST
jgi:hypothetical protein